MTVDVDYGAGHVIYSVDASEAFTSPISETVQGRATGVFGYLEDIEETADEAAEAALAKIALLQNFDAALTAVTWTKTFWFSPVVTHPKPFLDKELFRFACDVTFCLTGFFQRGCQVILVLVF